MLVSDALSKWHIEAEEIVHDVMSLSISQCFNAAHICHNYEHLSDN